MEPVTASLIAAQAIGVGMSYLSGKKQKRALNQQFAFGERIARAGGQMERAQLDLKMQEVQLAFTEQSIYDMENLRETMASQNALFGARGQAVGAGTARAISEKSVREYNYDVKARDIVNRFAKLNIMNAKQLSIFNENAAITEMAMGNEFKKQQIMDNFNTQLFNTIGSWGMMAANGGLGNQGTAKQSINSPKRAAMFNSLQKAGR